MNAGNSTGNPARLPLRERATSGLLLSEPDLALAELVALEHPADKAARLQLGAAIRAAIDYGDLVAWPVERTFQKERHATRFVFAGSAAGTKQPIFETWQIVTEFIDRKSYRQWRLTCPPELLSPLSQIQKWLGATPVIETILPAISLPESEPVAVAHGGAAEKTAALQSLLAEIDTRAAEQGAGFNRHCLPGTKAEFYELLKAYCPAWRYIGLSATADYLKGNCKFQHGVKPEHGKGAAIWALFPEYPNLKLG